MLFSSEVEVVERLVSIGSEAIPSLSHVMVGAGFPVNEQVSVTLLCSMTIRELGLSTTPGSTVLDKRAIIACMVCMSLIHVVICQYDAWL